MRRRVSSGSPMEPIIGFSRAVRVGNVIAVSGTAPVGRNGETLHPRDVENQTRACLEIAINAIAELGAGAGDVVRTRIMLTDISRWKEAAKAHGDVFAKVQPACTFVEVASFIDPGWLVEIELDAVCQTG